MSAAILCARRVRRAWRLAAGVLAVAGLAGSSPQAAEPPPPLRPAASKRPQVRDPLSLAYLRAFVARSPDDAGRRVELAREELAHGLLDDAERTLAPLLQSGGREVVRLALEVALANWRSLPPGDTRRSEAAGLAVARIDRLLTLRPVDLEVAVAAGRELGRPDLAARAAELAAQTDRFNAPKLLRQAARDRLAAGDPAGAAERLTAASAQAADEPLRRSLGLEAATAFEAAGLGGRAQSIVEQLLQRHPDDRELLGIALRLARALGQAQLARDLGRRLLGPSPSSPELERQLELELAAGARRRALAVAEKLARRGSPDGRREAARIAMWLHRPASALRHWMALARRGDAEGFSKAQELAVELGDAAAGAALLDLDRPVASEALEALVRTVEAHGSADRAAEALRRHLHRFPRQQRGWELLADLDERRGDLAAAVAALEAVQRRFGADLGRSVRTARLRWAMGERAAALASLSGLAAEVPVERTDYWHLLATLAWEASERRLAARAYRVLWDGGAPDVVAAERLVQLAREEGRPEEAIRVGRAGWDRLGQPRLLLLAADTAVATDRWSLLEELLDAAEARSQDFGSLVQYRLLRARLLEHHGRLGESLDEFRLALAIDPGSSEARAGVIWLLSGAGARQALNQALEAWQDQARSDPSLWRTWAVSLEGLGRHEEALAFRELELPARPGGEADPPGRGEAVGTWSGLDASSPPAASSPPDRDRPAALQLRRPESAPEAPASARLDARLEQFGSMAAQRTMVAGAYQGARLAWDLRVDSSEWLVGGALQPPKGRDLSTLGRLLLPALGGRIEAGAGGGTRDGVGYPRAVAALEAALTASLRGRLEMNFNEAADESAPLRLGALRSRVAGTLAAGVEQLSASTTVTWRGWTTPGGRGLGDGLLLAGDVGWHPWLAPALAIQLQGGWQSNRLRVVPAAALSDRWGGMAVLPSQAGELGIACGLRGWRTGRVVLGGSVWAGAIWPQVRPAYRAQAVVAVDLVAGTTLSVEAFAGDDPWQGAGDRGVGISFVNRFWM